MNPLRLLKIYRKADAVLTKFDTATKDWEQRKAKGEDMSKSLFQSKTFWFNVVMAVLELSQVLPIPAGTLLVVTTAANIVLRLFFTDQAAHVSAPKAAD